MLDNLILSSDTKNSSYESVSTETSNLDQEVQDVLHFLETLRPEVLSGVYECILIGIAQQGASVARKALSLAKEAHSQNRMTTSSRTHNASNATNTIPILESQLSRLQDPSDPLEAVEKLGSVEKLSLILPKEPLGVLEAMCRHPRMPHGPVISKSRAAKGLAAAIIKHLRQYSKE